MPVSDGLGDEVTRSTAVLVGCGSAKRDGLAAARNLYTSNYFKKKRAYAQAVGDDWRILSAKHRLFDPDRWLRPYDLSMADVEDPEHWARIVGGQLYPWLDVEFDGQVEVVVLAGRDYTDPLRPVLEELNIDARYPFDDTDGIGEQLAWLTEAVDTSMEGCSQ